MKTKRHNKILEIIASTNTVTQADLTKKLQESGFNVTQATVSRDIKELGLVKLKSLSGYKYALPSEVFSNKDNSLGLLIQSVISVCFAQHTVVVKTLSGMADAVAVGIDTTLSEEILGSIAGDDTILIITRSEQNAAELCERLKSICIPTKL